MVHTFSRGIGPNENVIAQLEFEIAKYDLAVQHFSHYTIGTTPDIFCVIPAEVFSTLAYMITNILI